MTDDPHPDMKGCFKYIPMANAPAGLQFSCPECGRLYTREKPRGGLAMWRAAPRRQSPTARPSVAH